MLEQKLQEAIRHHQAGALSEAERLYRQVLAEAEGHAVANHNLGVLALQCEQAQPALPYLKKAVEACPENGQYWLSYVDALHRAGHDDAVSAVIRQAEDIGLAPAILAQLKSRLEGPTQIEMEGLIRLFTVRQFDQMKEQALQLVARYPHSALLWKAVGTAQLLLGQCGDAIRSLRQSASLCATDPEVMVSLGQALQHEKCTVDAEACLRRAVLLAPENAKALSSLANLLQDLGRLAEAGDYFRQALASEPSMASAHNNLGLILRAQGQAAAAEECFRSALALSPELAEAYNNLGNVLKDQGRLAEAIASFRRALELRPEYPEAWNNLGNPLKGLGHLSEAEACLRRAIALNPAYAEAHNNLGNTLIELGRWQEAEAAFRTALACRPNYADAHANLGIVLKDMGRVTEAEASLRHALALAPDFLEAHDNLLFCMNYDPAHTPADCLGVARAYGERVARVAREASGRYATWQCERQPQKLRIGFVSGDLWRHPVGYFLESFLAELDPAQTELFAYVTHHKHDELSQSLQKHFLGWRSLLGKNDQEAAAQIHADGIHVLFDLAGHTAHNRLPLFSRRPAPVQVTWLGYFATTGLDMIDYLMADATGVTAADEPFYTERIWRLPDTRLCFTAPHDAPRVAPLPALGNGYVTFGCFQVLAKVNDNVLQAWREILADLPTARITWTCKQFDDAAVLQQLVGRMRAMGFDMTRVKLRGAVSRHNYLAAHADIDVILDTFPYPGGTTTCEALWMGVPTLTLMGDRLLSRQGASLLMAAGLDEWVARDQTDYIRKAAEFGADLATLGALRNCLRQRVAGSPLFDASRFASNFQAATRAMYGRWEMAAAAGQAS